MTYDHCAKSSYAVPVEADVGNPSRPSLDDRHAPRAEKHSNENPKDSYDDLT